MDGGHAGGDDVGMVFEGEERGMSEGELCGECTTEDNTTPEEEFGEEVKGFKAKEEKEGRVGGSPDGEEGGEERGEECRELLICCSDEWCSSTPLRPCSGLPITTKASSALSTLRRSESISNKNSQK